jgi:hypothetical protein
MFKRSRDKSEAVTTRPTNIDHCVQPSCVARRPDVAWTKQINPGEIAKTTLSTTRPHKHTRARGPDMTPTRRSTESQHTHTANGAPIPPQLSAQLTTQSTPEVLLYKTHDFRQRSCLTSDDAPSGDRCRFKKSSGPTARATGDGRADVQGQLQSTHSQALPSLLDASSTPPPA